MARRIVSRGGIGLVEIGVQPCRADQAPNRLARGGEIAPTGLDPIIAAARIVVAESDDRWLAGKGLGQQVGDEDGRLDGHFGDDLRCRRDVQGLGGLLLELVGKEIARHDGEIGIGRSFGEGGEARHQQGVVGVPAAA